LEKAFLESTYYQGLGIGTFFTITNGTIRENSFSISRDLSGFAERDMQDF